MPHGLHQWAPEACRPLQGEPQAPGCIPDQYPHSTPPPPLRPVYCIDTPCSAALLDHMGPSSPTALHCISLPYFLGWGQAKKTYRMKGEPGDLGYYWSQSDVGNSGQAEASGPPFLNPQPLTVHMQPTGHQSWLISSDGVFIKAQEIY